MSTKGTAEKKGGGIKQVLLTIMQSYAVFLVWIVVFILYSILIPRIFLSMGNFSTMLGSQSTLLILSLGMLFPLTAGDIDLSAANVLALSNMLLAVLNAQMGWPIGWTILFALAIGALVGFINGALVTSLDIDPFIITLGVGTFLNGVILLISNSTTIAGISPALQNMVVINRFLGIPYQFFYGLALCVLLWYFFEHMAAGRKILYVGRGRMVSLMSGIAVKKVRWSSFIVCSMIAALAGIIYGGTTGSADPTSGQTFQMPALAAAYLGSTCIKPGRFNAWGSFAAVYFLVTGITGLSLMGIQSFVQNLFYGGALLLAVCFSQIIRKNQEKSIKVRKAD